MPIILKTRREIEMMRRAGQVAHEILAQDAQGRVPGVTTLRTRQVAKAETGKGGAIGMSQELSRPTRMARDFPDTPASASTKKWCTGFPGTGSLKEGDIVTLDLAMSLDGYCCRHRHHRRPRAESSPTLQSCWMSPAQTLELAMEHIKPGKRWSDIARLMQYNVETQRIQRGARICRSRHRPAACTKIRKCRISSPASSFAAISSCAPGMTLAVEPMVVDGPARSGFAARSMDRGDHDGLPAAHFEQRSR